VCKLRSVNCSWIFSNEFAARQSVAMRRKPYGASEWVSLQMARDPGAGARTEYPASYREARLPATAATHAPLITEPATIVIDQTDAALASATTAMGSVLECYLYDIAW
jgi:hypothetical protein